MKEMNKEMELNMNELEKVNGGYTGEENPDKYDSVQEVEWPYEPFPCPLPMPEYPCVDKDNIFTL